MMVRKKPHVVPAMDGTKTFKFACDCGRTVKEWQKFCPECGYLLDWEGVYTGLKELLRRLEVE